MVSGPMLLVMSLVLAYRCSVHPTKRLNTGYNFIRLEPIGEGGCKGGKSLPPPIFFNLIVFWLLSLRGANKKILIFSKQLFGWCKVRKY
jgi:hypothetical protein